MLEKNNNTLVPGGTPCSVGTRSEKPTEIFLDGLVMDLHLCGPFDFTFVIPNLMSTQYYSVCVCVCACVRASFFVNACESNIY